MNKIAYQTIRSPSGDELVVLPKADFDALAHAAAAAEEDADDVAIFNSRMADLKSGADAPLPVEVSAFMLKGDSQLRALRHWRKMTQSEVAQKTGLAQGYISDIEAGRKDGTSQALAKIAKALEVEQVWLGIDNWNQKLPPPSR